MNIDEFIILLSQYLDNKLKNVACDESMLKLSLFWLILQNSKLKEAGTLIDELTREKGADWK